MPFIRVSYLRHRYDEQRLNRVSESIMRALVEHFNVPRDDFFQVYHAHAPGEFYYSPSYLNVERTDDLLYIQITLKSGRTVDQKKRFYATLAELLARNAGMRKEDVFVVLVGTEYEDWTFGNGIAQMLEITQGKERAVHGASVDSD
jgi:Uncharacterized protein, 4-oxalocrotonate tautomerase homolog